MLGPLHTLSLILKTVLQVRYYQPYLMDENKNTLTLSGLSIITQKGPGNRTEVSLGPSPWVSLREGLQLLPTLQGG